jgi:hypothetical protein
MEFSERMVLSSLSELNPYEGNLPNCDEAHEGLGVVSYNSKL